MFGNYHKTDFKYSADFVQRATE